MLAKIHLKTACGCERSHFESIDRVPREVRIPIKATINQLWAGRITPMTVSNLRIFKFVRLDVRSKRRIELWFEEEFDG